MKKRPTIETERLILRPFVIADAAEVQRLAGDKEIASTTQNIPHPYEGGMAEQWIATHQEQYEKGELVNFAITLRNEATLVGAIGLVLNQNDLRGEIGYWVGKPYWNNGYSTEAARAVLQYGFEVLGLNRIHACHLTRNPASGRVMQKIGMTHEGISREHAVKWGVPEDIENYAILRREFQVKKYVLN